VRVEHHQRAQDGLITRDQALECGLTRAAIAHRVATGAWVRVLPEVYRAATHAETTRSRVRAALLWLGSDAVLVGVAAAWWWGLSDDPPETVHAAVPTTRRVRSRPGVAVERRDLALADRSEHDGLAITTRARTVVDAAGALGRTSGGALMDRALARRRVTLQSLRAAYRRGMGRRGSAAVAALLVLAAGGARSEAERRLHALLRSAGIVGWIADHRVVLPTWGPAVVDLVFADRRLAIEVDGWAYHRDLAAFRRDPQRQNALVLAGWTVLRVTWHDVVGDPDSVLTTIRGALVT
jgi:very-short-patch-repair endonuclease